MIKRLAAVAAVASCWAAEITCELDANAPSRVLGLGHATPVARASATHNWAAGQMFFLSCCPWPLIGFQRRLVEIGKIAHLHLQPPPPSPICFSRQATHNLRVVQKERKCERLQVACGSVAGKRRVSVALADEIWAGLQQTPELVAATAGSATDAPCGYACRGVCGRLMDCPRLPWALTGIEWLVRRCL